MTTINKSQQLELDTIEKQVLILLFGSETIPDTTGTILSMYGINPNSLIREFEQRVSPFMNENGSINGNFIKKILLITPKYKKILNYIDIPDDDFFLSNKVFDIIKAILPGVNP